MRRIAANIAGQLLALLSPPPAQIGVALSR